MNKTCDLAYGVDDAVRAGSPPTNDIEYAGIGSSPLHWIRTGPRGTGTIVFLHAVGFDLTYWDQQIESFRRTHDIVAFDLPGHGRSPGTPQEWTFENAVAAIVRLLGTLNTGPVHLVGVSFGGMIAQKALIRHPELFRSATLIGTASSFAEPVRAGMRARAEATREGGMQAVLESSLKRWFTPETMERRPDLIDRVSKTILGDDPKIHAAIWDLIANDFDVDERLGEIQCPTLVIVGEKDPSTPVAAAMNLKSRIPGAEIIIIPETSHMATIESPVAVNAELARFLQTK